MKAFIFSIVFLMFSGIAVGAEPDLIGPPPTELVDLTDEPSTELEKSELEKCVDRETSDIPPEGIAALFPALLVLLRFAAEALGKIGAKGNATASIVSRVFFYLINLLGYLFGKMGWGSVRAENIKTLPKFRKKKT